MQVDYNGKTFEWDSKSKVVKVDGVVDKNWEPIFTENGNDLIFYGLHNKATNESVDYLGKKLDVTDPDSIKI